MPGGLGIYYPLDPLVEAVLKCAPSAPPPGKERPSSSHERSDARTKHRKKHSRCRSLSSPKSPSSDVGSPSSPKSRAAGNPNIVQELQDELRGMLEYNQKREGQRSPRKPWAVEFDNGERHRYTEDQIQQKFGVTALHGTVVNHKVRGRGTVVDNDRVEIPPHAEASDAGRECMRGVAH